MKAADPDNRSSPLPAAGKAAPAIGPAADAGSELAVFWRRVARSARRRGRNYLKPRVWLMALIHLVVFALVYWTAFLLRFEFAIRTRRS